MDAGLVIILVCSLVAISGALLGSFLVLRRMAMMSDAISHSILFGIVVGFLVARTTQSALMIVGAALAGLLTVYLTEVILRSRLVKEDASIGLVFPFLFSLGVLIISQQISGLHVDIDAALVGEVIWAPFDTVLVGTAEIPRSLLIMGAITLVDLLFVALFYKELKLATFDAGLAVALGFSPALIHYTLMALLSVTAVGAFDAVGAVLFVAFIVVPASAAYLLTDRLPRMIAIAAGIGVAACVFGYGLAVAWDASISGCIVVALGALFALTLIFAPERGLLAGWLRRRRQRWEFAAHLLIGHLLHHEGQPDEAQETAVAALPLHLRWEQTFTEEIVRRADRRGWVAQEAGRLHLTERGRQIGHQIGIAGRA